MKPSSNLYQIKITLGMIKPPIWRRLLVPAGIKLDRLSLAIQIAMGWYGGHLHQFVHRNKYYGIPDDDFPEPETLNEKRFSLEYFLKKVKDQLRYEYDFGDGWTHTILLEKILDNKTKLRMPICMKGKRACPPEDCGGPWGYQSLLEILSNPGHPDHDSMKEWIGGEFDPEFFDENIVNEDFASYSKELT